MTSAAQIQANQINAQASTGPKTAEGKAASSRNAMSHGFTASPETLFAQNPVAKQEFETLRAKLHKLCQPKNEAEDEAFQQYVYGTYQVQRAHQMEVHYQELLFEDPFNDKILRYFEAAEKFGAKYARRARAAFKELQTLQQDRFERLRVEEACAINGIPGVKVGIGIPLRDITGGDSKSNIILTSLLLFSDTPEAKERLKMRKETEAKERTQSK
jgi:hypothetical protein